MDMKSQAEKREDQIAVGASSGCAERPPQRPLAARLADWLRRWGADVLLAAGAGCISAGVGWIYPPAGAIAAGVLLIAGGVLWAKGGDGA